MLKKKKKKIYIKNLHSSSVSFVLLMNIGMERGGAERNGAKKKKKILKRQQAGYALQWVASRSTCILFTLQQDSYSVASMKYFWVCQHTTFSFAAAELSKTVCHTLQTRLSKCKVVLARPPSLAHTLGTGWTASLSAPTAMYPYIFRLQCPLTPVSCLVCLICTKSCEWKQCCIVCFQCICSMVLCF